MNIKNLHDSIIDLYSKNGLKKKNIRRELIAFISIKVLSDISKMLLTEETFKQLLGKISLDNINIPNVDEIVFALNKHILFSNKEELFNSITTMIDDISKIYNPQHGQHYTNQSMALLSANLLLKDVSIEEINKKEEITIYEPSIGSGNLIFPLVDLLVARGIKKEKIKIYANEFDDEVALVAKLLLEIKDLKYEIKIGDTLVNYFTDKQGDLKKFDFVVSNPPFGVKFNPNKLKEHKIYSNYLVKEKLQIGKSSNSLPVFVEIIRNSFNIAGLIINNDCSFDKHFKNGTYTNSVLGNIINNRQLNTLVMQPKNMFVNTDITTNIMLLSNNNKEVSFVDTDARYLYIKNMYSISKMKNGYSKENIFKILERIKNEDGIKYNNTVLLDAKKLQESFLNQHKETISIIEKIKNDFEYSLDMLTMQLTILNLAVSHEGVFNKICIKHGFKDSNEVTKLIDGKDAISINTFIESIKKEYSLKEVTFMGLSRYDKYKFLINDCTLELENILNTKKTSKILSNIYKDVTAFYQYIDTQSVNLDNILFPLPKKDLSLSAKKAKRPVALLEEKNLFDFIQ